MAKSDRFYWHLLHECQSADLQRRLKGLEDLRRYDYLDRVDGEFLLDRFNVTTDDQEQTALLRMMREIKKPAPVDSLMAILADTETTSIFLRMEVAHTLAVLQAEEAFDLCLRLALDPEEHLWLRETLISCFSYWKERISDEVLLTLLKDPLPAICSATIELWRERPAQVIPLELLLPYLNHKGKYVREAAIKTVMAAEQRVPIEPILLALQDPESEVRSAASYACISLTLWFGAKVPLEPLLAALSDDYPPVRENILDAFGHIPLSIPVEPVAAALSDETYYVRCAALETLALMGECVPSSLYPQLRELSGSDPVAQVRLRATRALLMLHGMQPPPLRLPMIDIASEDDVER